MSDTGMVFHIQRFSVHDGPGIRTTVFLKGCALECFWCHNPEGQRASPEIRYFADRCIACGSCVPACPREAHAVLDGHHTFLRERCGETGACVPACCAEALQVNGRRMTVAGVIAEVIADRPFYESSGGGVTLSGGEPTLGGAFALDLLEECKALGLHTALETCGECPWSSLASLLPATDLVMMDLKVMSAEKHREATGKGNARILANARRLARADVPLVFRTPVVRGVNDSAEEIARIASFIREIAAGRTAAAAHGAGTREIHYELLRFHRLASDKYASLGRPYRAASLEPLPQPEMLGLLEAARNTGIDARIGG
jgi:pyruvate formate lyase activating enzyme